MDHCKVNKVVKTLHCLWSKTISLIVMTRLNFSDDVYNFERESKRRFNLLNPINHSL